MAHFGRKKSQKYQFFENFQLLGVAGPPLTGRSRLTRKGQSEPSWQEGGLNLLSRPEGGGAPPLPIRPPYTGPRAPSLSNINIWNKSGISQGNRARWGGLLLLQWVELQPHASPHPRPANARTHARSTLYSNIWPTTTGLHQCRCASIRLKAPCCPTMPPISGQPSIRASPPRAVGHCIGWKACQ